MAEIRVAYLELDLAMWHSRLEASNVIYAFQIENGVLTAMESRVSTAIENRVFTTIESRISTSLKLASALDQHGGRVHKSCVLSYTRSMSLLLQSV